MSKKKPTLTVYLSSVKDPDVWGEVIRHFKMSDAKRNKHFEFSEYATLELEIDENMNIVGGCIVGR